MGGIKPTFIIILQKKYAPFEASGFEIDSLLRTNFEKEDGSLDVDVQIIGVKQLKKLKKIC